MQECSESCEGFRNIFLDKITKRSRNIEEKNKKIKNKQYYCLNKQK